MPTLQRNHILYGLSGRLGNLVLRQLHGKTIVQAAPVRTAPVTPGERANRETFRQAVAYAKETRQNPEIWEIYQAEAKRRGGTSNAYAVAISDFRKGFGLFTELVNIFDKDLFQQEVENTLGERAKADKIISRTCKYITAKMDDDPAFYKRFSEMLKQAIREHEEKRLSDAELLKKVKEIMDAVLSRTEPGLPAELANKEVAKAFYGLSLEALTPKVQDGVILRAIATDAALRIDQIITEAVLDNGLPVIDWASPKSNILGALQIAIGDYLIDEVRDKYGIALTFGEMDALAEQCIDVAKIRYRS